MALCTTETGQNQPNCDSAALCAIKKCLLPKKGGILDFLLHKVQLKRILPPFRAILIVQSAITPEEGARIVNFKDILLTCIYSNSPLCSIPLSNETLLSLTANTNRNTFDNIIAYLMEGFKARFFWFWASFFGYSGVGGETSGASSSFTN
ncbi:hypothetical protein D3C87_1728290 [compost metagenome]